MPHALRQWLERRTGFGEWISNARDLELPEAAARRPSLGAVLVFALALQIATGLLLLLYFVPDPTGAFESVRSLMRDVPYGWLIRLVHAHGANWTVAIVFVHLFHTSFQGAYKDPRELVWVSGCVLFLLVLGSALTGYILPWSQMSYWATTVVTASVSYAPLVGEDLVALIRGGEFVGDATYRRAFAAHVGLLPLVLLGAVALHLALVRRAGVAGAPHRRGESAPVRRIAFHPQVSLAHAISIVGFSMVLVASVFFVPNLFFPADHLMAADPFETPANVKPEWYFLWAYQLPRMIPEGLSLVCQGLALAGLFALPFLDRSPHRHPLDRPFVTAALVLAVVLLVGLSVLGHLA